MIPIVECMNSDLQKKKQLNQKVQIVYPADYEIIVQGKLDIGWSQRMSDMTMAITGGGGQTPKLPCGETSWINRHCSGC